MARPYRTRTDERDIFRALAHPVRRAMISASINQTRSFKQLRELVHRSDATVASHLRILREAHLLIATRSGRSVSYHVNKHTLRSGSQWFSGIVRVQAEAPASR